MKPSTVLSVYCLSTFVVGLFLAALTAYGVHQHVFGSNGAALTALCWNLVFVMILPLVLDASEQKYFKARFLQLEEVAKTNPELASMLNEQTKKMSVPNLRLAVVDSPHHQVFGYSLWGINPRLIIPNCLLGKQDVKVLIPSIEAEFNRFNSQDHTVVFLLFTAVQIALQQFLLTVM